MSRKHGHQLLILSVVQSLKEITNLTTFLVHFVIRLTINLINRHISSRYGWSSWLWFITWRIAMNFITTINGMTMEITVSTEGPLFLLTPVIPSRSSIRSKPFRSFIVKSKCQAINRICSP